MTKKQVVSVTVFIVLALILAGCTSTRPLPTQKVNVVVTEACVDNVPEPLVTYSDEELRLLDDGKRVLALYVNQERMKERITLLDALIDKCRETK